MQGTDPKELELGYLYYSLYSYRREIEADIKKIIREQKSGNKSALSEQTQGTTSSALLEQTQKLRNISMIISKLISLNKVYK